MCIADGDKDHRLLMLEAFAQKRPSKRYIRRLAIELPITIEERRDSLDVVNRCLRYGR
jgi:hypothetical protein